MIMPLTQIWALEKIKVQIGGHSKINKNLNKQIIKLGIEYYKRKLREFEILATAFKKSDYEIPGFLISNGVNSSQMVRNIEKRMKYQ